MVTWGDKLTKVEQKSHRSEPLVQTHIQSGQQQLLSRVLLTSVPGMISANQCAECLLQAPGQGPLPTNPKARCSLGGAQENADRPLTRLSPGSTEQTGSKLIIQIILKGQTPPAAARTAPLTEGAPGQCPQRTASPKHSNDLPRGEVSNRKQEGQKGQDQISSSLDRPLALVSLSIYLSAAEAAGHTFTPGLYTLCQWNAERPSTELAQRYSRSRGVIWGGWS